MEKNPQRTYGNNHKKKNFFPVIIIKIHYLIISDILVNKNLIRMISINLITYI